MRKRLRMVLALCEYLGECIVQLPILSLATPIFLTKFVTVEAIRNSMCQCSSYSGHTHLQLLNCVILSNIEVECLAGVRTCTHLMCNGMLKEVRQDSVSRLHLHLWAGINKTKKWKFSKKIFANTLRFAKFANIFFRELFLLYGTLLAYFTAWITKPQCLKPLL